MAFRAISFGFVRFRAAVALGYPEPWARSKFKVLQNLLNLAKYFHGW